jgi:hypothetical protein
MVIDYFNDCARARGHGIAAQKKFIGIFRSMAWYLSSTASRKVKDCVMEE